MNSSQSSESTASPPQRRGRQKWLQVHSADACEPILPTPVRRRLCNSQLSSPCTDASSSMLPNMHELAPGLETTGTIATSGDPSRRTLQDIIYRTAESLLKATCHRNACTAGPKSLLSMCLRKVPGYMAELERQELAEAEENGTKTLDGSTASFDVYSELESLGAAAGWKHLRVVARAHGLRILADAVAEGLLGPPFAARLLQLAARHMPLAECEVLLDAHVVRAYPPPAGVHDSIRHTPALAPLRVLYADPRRGTMSPMGWRKMAQLLDRRLLPAAWIVTPDFQHAWRAAIKSVFEDARAEPTLEFLVTASGRLCALANSRATRHSSSLDVGSAAQKALVNLLGTLVSIVMLDRRYSTHDSSHTHAASVPDASMLQRLHHLIQSSLADLQGRGSGGKQFGRYIFATCGYLVCNDGDLHKQQYGDMMAKLWARERGRAEHQARYAATMSMLSFIAHCYGCGVPEAPYHTHLLPLCDALGNLQLPGDPLKSVRTDAAFRLAEQTQDLRDLAFAESLVARGAELTSSTGCGRQPRRTPRKSAAFCGFRWDEDISEWVTATPAPAALGRRSRVQPRFVGEESVNSTDAGEPGLGSAFEGSGGVHEFDTTATTEMTDGVFTPSDQPASPVVPARTSETASDDETSWDRALPATPNLRPRKVARRVKRATEAVRRSSRVRGLHTTQDELSAVRPGWETEDGSEDSRMLGSRPRRVDGARRSLRFPRGLSVESSDDELGP